MLTPSQIALLKYLLVYEPTSRKRLSQILNLTTAAVTLMVNQLLERGLVKELYELDTGKVGRKETLLDVEENALYALGLDIFESEIKLSVTNLKSVLIDKRVFSTIDEAIEYLRSYVKDRADIIGISVLLRGFVNNATYFHRDKNIEVKLKSLGIPYKFINNVSALAIMHKYYHFDDSNFLLVKYGPGVGSAIMVNGELIKPKSNTHSEIGQMILEPSSYRRLESCIHYDTLFKNINNTDIIHELKQNEDVRNYLINCLSMSIINSNVLLSLDKIVLAGVIFTEETIYNALCEKIISLSSTLSLSDITRVDHYDKRIEKIGSVVTLYYFLSGQMF